MNDDRDDYDGAWKEALELYLFEALELLFPALYARLDPSQPPTFLDKELAAVARDSEHGTSIADKLARVTGRDGAPALLLVHVEVQCQAIEKLVERVLVVNVRILDHLALPVVSVAVLGDDRPGWRPSDWRFELGGFRHVLEIPVSKLLDWEGRENELETSKNPFAVFVLAHLKTIRTRKDPAARLQCKREVVKSLYGRGWTAGQVRRLFRVVDWLLRLPDELEDRFWKELVEYERSGGVEHLTSIERITRQRAEKAAREQVEQVRKDVEQQSLRDALLRILRARFGDPVPESVATRVGAVSDPETLARLIDAGAVRATLAEFERELPPVGPS